MYYYKEGGDIPVPTITPYGSYEDAKNRKHRTQVIAAAGAGAALFVAMALTIVYLCLMHAKRSARRTSAATASSSQHCEETSMRKQRSFTFKELEQATASFNQKNIVGQGGFGTVYKGLLQNGSLVAIKRRFHQPSQHFLQQAMNIGNIQHKHIVKLRGYCQETHQQMLVYDYFPNSNVGFHLYDAEGLPLGKLGIQQRLSIALDAAKGLQFLHALAPPVLHMNFKTSNVLVDESFIAKVADFGLSKFIERRSTTTNWFLDPQLKRGDVFSEKSDVYGFGVFLLELITGYRVTNRNPAWNGLNLIEQARSVSDPSVLCLHDERIKASPVAAKQAWSVMKLAMQCVDAGARRPTMSMVVQELKQIVQCPVISNVALGSHLFKRNA
ncbi:probable leucine-rich repeat receptor-like protein kinase At5g49770 [Dioscorea cayenensis subsp. rotundata]|uniref:non-specific serine/threonine protein kinase n=1 Tax=Dioscorea cayennensis subsp. rotundata TaxID=55577 RepID=A0AB40CF77_DIOCR|nr:probable leucine-rich repeat receptor-like protein kinase At5g49770 [Dioscorea cayenensis subsp. rotundata]